jgi:gliding motility-associated-like protein
MRTVILLLLVFTSFFTNGQMDLAGSGRAIAFDGVDDLVDFGDILDDVELPVSISAWINVEPSNTVHSPIFVSQDNQSLYNGFWFIINATNIFVGYGDGRGYNNPVFRREKTATHPGIFNRWAHVAAVIRNAQDMDIYVDGVNINGIYTGSSSFPMDSQFPNEIATVGHWVTNDVYHHFKGKIDDVRIWDIALSEDDIRKNMCSKLNGNEEGLLAYWTFDEVSGIAVADGSKNGYSGSLRNGASRVFSGAAIGDVSIFDYQEPASLSYDDLVVHNIAGAPKGIHLYKVSHPPSQVGGLRGSIPNEYYGVYAANFHASTNFDISPCILFERGNNSDALWETGGTSFADRAEVIKGLSARTEFDLGPDRFVCESLYILKPNIDLTGKAFHWSTGSREPEITITETGIYTLVIDGECGNSEASVKIEFAPEHPEIDLGPDLFICEGERIVVEIPPYQGDRTVEWNTGGTGNSIEIIEPGEYIVTISDECRDYVDTLNVHFRSPLSPDNVPNVITPNSDEWNEYFVIETDSGMSIDLEIFNRWGKGVFHSRNYAGEWNANELSGGVYYYQVTDGCGKRIRGTVHVLN